MRTHTTETKCRRLTSSRRLGKASSHLRTTHQRGGLSCRCVPSLPATKCTLILALSFLCAACAWPQRGGSAIPAPLSAAQIVERMQQHDKAQKEALKSYTAIRHYEVEYHGFFRRVAAKMDVEINYTVASGKSFRVISESGSHALCSMVLKRAVDSELEASRTKDETALTEANYRFEFAGVDRLADRLAYVLNVEPITPSRFLYRGKIWVDAADFAVAKMEVRPAKNPSFWISRTLIHHLNERTGGFWLPEENHSETKVRIGGTAVMTINYGTYQIVSQPRLMSSALPYSGCCPPCFRSGDVPCREGDGLK